MKGILHIINGYTGNKVYKNLVTALDSKDIPQWVYVPIRTPGDQSRYQNFELKNTVYSYSYIIRSIFDRLFFFRKIRIIGRDIEGNSHFSPDLQIHAHTLFSDGGVAWLLHRKHKMEYLVAVRNTDVNLFFKYFFFLRRFGEKVLLDSKQVIFLSPAYQEEVLNKYIRPSKKDTIQKKSKVIPNGVNSFWQENIYQRSTFNQKIIRLLYVGEIRKNKNIHTTLAAISILRDRGLDVTFSVIGFGLNDESGYVDRIRTLCENLPYVTLIEQIQDKSVLLQYYRDADVFIMPSFTETFGLVYAEAMTQGLPLIYSKGQGVDGYFKQGRIGYAVDPHNPENIADRVQQIGERYLDISKFNSVRAKLLNWNRIGATYKSIYES